MNGQYSKVLFCDFVIDVVIHYEEYAMKLLIKKKNQYVFNMIQAEISIYPMATKTTSVSFYIAKAIESIQNIENLRYEINPMGTILESDCIDVINSASKKMIETVHNLGISRVEIIIKIDSRKDKHHKMEEKIESIKKQMTK